MSTGRLGGIDRFELTLPAFQRPIRGKVFLKGILGLTGMEAFQAEQGSMPDAEAADDGERVGERPAWR